MVVEPICGDHILAPQTRGPPQQALPALGSIGFLNLLHRNNQLYMAPDRALPSDIKTAPFLGRSDNQKLTGGIDGRQG
jgi:hypothetical protein